MSRYKKDDVIKAKVINISLNEKKIGLSIKRLEDGDTKDVFNSYVNNKKEATSNLGDLLRKGMLNLESRSGPDEAQGSGDQISSEGEKPAEDEPSEV